MILVNSEKRLVRIRKPALGLDLTISPESESDHIDDNLRKAITPIAKSLGLKIKLSGTVTAPAKAEAILEPAKVEEEAEEVKQEVTSTPEPEIIKDDKEPEKVRKPVRRNKRNQKPTP